MAKSSEETDLGVSPHLLESFECGMNSTCFFPKQFSQETKWARVLRTLADTEVSNGETRHAGKVPGECEGCIQRPDGVLSFWSISHYLYYLMVSPTATEQAWWVCLLCWHLPDSSDPSCSPDRVTHPSLHIILQGPWKHWALPEHLYLHNKVKVSLSLLLLLLLSLFQTLLSALLCN